MALNAVGQGEMMPVLEPVEVNYGERPKTVLAVSGYAN